MMKLVSAEWRGAGRATPRSGEGHGKSVNQLINQVATGKAVSKIQAGKLRKKLTKFKTQLKNTTKKLEKGKRSMARLDVKIKSGEKKVAELALLIASIEAKLTKPKDE